MTDHAYFHDLYAGSADPWQLAEREYEQRKHALTIASLPRRTYRRAFEPGCSVGLLTGLLVERCGEVVASDVVPEPLEAAARRAPDATFRLGAVPHDWPEGRFDLVVLSELMYYLSTTDRLRVLAQARDSLDPDGHLAVVHWRHDFEAAQCDGDVVHAEIAADTAWRPLVAHVEADFRLEVFAPASS